MKKFLLAAALFFTFCAFANEKPVRLSLSKPNVILIIADDLNDWQGAYGGHPQAKTPHIDALAASGSRFINAQSNSPLCAPSRNSLVTGIYPFHSNDLGFSSYHNVPTLFNSKTIMNLLLENGYETYGIGKIYHNYHGTTFNAEWTEFNKLPGDQQGPFPYDGSNYLAHPEVPAPYSNIGHIDGSYGRLSTGAGSAGWVYGKGYPFTYASANDRDLMPGELRAKWVADKLEAYENKREQKPFIRFE